MIPYSTYRTSSCDWIDRIPANWRAQRIKSIFGLRDERNFKPLNEVNLISLYTGLGVRQHKDIEHTTGNKARNADGYKVVYPDDIVVNILLCWMGAIGRSDYHGVTSPAYDIYKPKTTEINTQYYNYLMRTPMFAQQCYRVGKGIMAMRWRTYSPQFSNIVIPVPPRSEQDQIVRFLDWKVSSINKLINIQKKQVRVIEELKEKVVCEALLHGIDAGISYKDSGIAWIESIPAQWKVIKIKWLFGEADERNTDEDAELLTFSKKRGLIPFSEASDKMPSASDLSNYKLLHIGQLLENRMQAWHGMFICADREGCVSPDYSVFSASKEREVNVKFYEYAFRSHIWVEQFAIASRGVGSGFNRLYTPQFGAIYTVYPEINEQNRIVEYLDIKIAQLNALIEQIEERIKGLEELKTTLISDVVTGKIDVRSIEIPEYKFVDEDTDADNEDDSEEKTDEQED